MESLVMFEQLRQFFAGRNVFLTGHTGFKGIWLSLVLKKLGANTKGYALEPEESKPFYDLFPPAVVNESVIADIRDKARLEQELLSFQPDYIFHLAAQPLVLRSYELPAETFEINVTGTANVLECLRKLDKACAVVVVTTDKVYENKEQNVLYQETDRLGGFDPYSASKACTEIVVESFRSSFFPPDKANSHRKAIASARAGNVIGGGDWSSNRIVPDIARSLLKNEPVFVRNPGSVRPWQHVLEPLVAYLLLGGKLYHDPGHFARPYNFGPNAEDHLTVKELVDLAIQTWGSGRLQIDTDANKPHEAKLLQLDIRRARKELGWEPGLTAKQAIEWAISWYKTPVSHQAQFTLQQIDNYLLK